MIADRPMCGCVGAILLMLMASPVEARQPGGASANQEVALAACIRNAAGGRGWLEKTLWALRDQEGGWIGAQIANPDDSHDLGPLQVNSWWVSRLAVASSRPSADMRRWLIHDPCFNVDAARWIFLSGLAMTGDYWKAVGVHHSPTGWRQRRYAQSVARHLKRRFGPRIFARSSS